MSGGGCGGADLVLGPSLTKTAFHMQNRKNMTQNPSSIDLSTEWHSEGDMDKECLECGSLHEISRWCSS